jgi:DNA-binding transcriptional MerR regulator
MELQTISQISKQFKISTRTLRYYEQIGLIQSTVKEDYSYRTYDESTILRLKQIIVLRKLRIPLKSIAEILLTENTALLIEVFQQNLSEIGEEITALTTIKNVIQSFIERLDLKNTKLQLLDDESLLEIVDSLTTSKIKFKEDKTMDDLVKADEKLNKLTDRNVRIMYLPPSDVAAYQYEGDDPEMHVHQVMDPFVRESNLSAIKPDLRHYGFNSPNPVDETGRHGYEVWVTIPDGFSVPKPLVKKHFEGGLYGAHMIPFGAFEEWGLIDHWLHNNDRYEYRGAGDSRNMLGMLEEALNYVNRVHLSDPEEEGFQLDLLVPIKEK